MFLTKEYIKIFNIYMLRQILCMSEGRKFLVSMETCMCDCDDEEKTITYMIIGSLVLFCKKWERS